MQKKKYTSIIIIPCYNEAERFNIDYYQQFVQKEISKLIIFVNDGSKDNTTDIIDQIIARYENAVKLVLEQNQGKAEAVRQGVLYALEIMNSTLLVCRCRSIHKVGGV
jgi:glycosyltransferase involved in cell wall biosynthesis